MPDAQSPLPYTAPARATLLQKLGPGGLITYLLAVASTLLLFGLPLFWRLRRVLRAAVSQVPSPADIILVLGRKLQDDHPTDVFRARLSHAAELWRRGLAPRILVAGGITGRASRSEAEAGLAWLHAQALPPAALLAEGRSQHTLENLFWVRELARAEGWRSLTVVSDPLHLARAQAMAEGLGLRTFLSPATSAPPAPGTFRWWRRAISEAFLLHWYHTGVLYSRLTGSKKKLARIT
jgi:uncharacterized SAM-binding protein YcdF (DUF218 family)